MRALAEVLQAISDGGLTVQARHVGQGTVAAIPPPEMAILEFHIADDIPGQPYGFRNVRDRVLEWVDPTISAVQAMVYWPPMASERRPDA
jgi:hypothetical protein